jgi:hypothetical protein
VVGLGRRLELPLPDTGLEGMLEFLDLEEGDALPGL